MPRITFLEADRSLTKSFSVAADGTLSKSSYPRALNFTSHTTECPTLHSLSTQLQERSPLGHCLLKGTIRRPIINEPRAGTTDTLGTTDWTAWDLDRSPFANSAEFMMSTRLASADYLEQLSASHGISTINTPAATGLSSHIYQFLTNPYPAEVLKQLLLYLNLSVPQLRAAIKLTRTGSALSYSLDITTCQNDKLIYTADPVIGEGVISTHTGPRVIYHQGTNGHVRLDLEPLLKDMPSMEALNEEARALKNQLRKAQNLPVQRSGTTIQDGMEVMAKPGEATITGRKVDRGFVYFNLNGGDSWGYYHAVNNFEYIYNFKGEPVYPTKALLPSYYASLKTEHREAAQVPSESGDLLLAFRDLKTATYWNGTWNPQTEVLDLHMAKSELQLGHFLQNHGRSPDDFVPIWSLLFNPRSDTIIDTAGRTINTYVPPPALRAHRARVTGGMIWAPAGNTPLEQLALLPIINRIATSAIGRGMTLEHAINWTACVYQLCVKLGTAWLLHGLPGTGKGLWVNAILAATLGSQYVVAKRAKEMESDYTGWLEKALIAFIDEVQPPRQGRGDYMEADLKNLITEPVISIRHMYRQAYPMENFTNFILSSNRNEPWNIERSDRRFNIGDYGDSPLAITPDEVTKGIPAELDNFLDFIMTTKADEGRARRVLESAARNTMLNTSRTSADMVADAVRDGDIGFFYDSMPDRDLAEAIGGYSTHNVYGDQVTRIVMAAIKSRIGLSPDAPWRDKLSRDELWTLFEYCVGNIPKSPSKFGQYMRHRGIEFKRMRKDDKLVYGIDVTWQAPQEWLDERIAELTPKKKVKEAA